jgi:lipopolysaccharide/colanic/teichoic acid biosynthesis glycosyltransferase
MHRRPHIAAASRVTGHDGGGASGQTVPRRDAGRLRRAPADRVRSTGKLLVDLVLGAVLAVLSLPLVALLAVAVAISLRANPFFVHHRVGRDGSVFPIPKLRTLSPRAPRYADKHALDYEADTTRLTALLRRLHLDELPQLFLVPLGLMSLVGPRPEMAHLYGRMPERQGGTRLRYRPGCTGLWQVSVGYSDLIGASPAYDIYYAEHHTLRLDLWILWRTALTTVGIDRPIDLADVPRWTYARAVARGLPRGQRPWVEIDRRGEERGAAPVWFDRVRHAAEQIGEQPVPVRPIADLDAGLA